MRPTLRGLGFRRRDGGRWCAIPSSVSAELMATLDFDWLCIDAQHGLMSYEQLLGMVQAVQITGTATFVRVQWNDPGEIGRALDAGAQGVVVPMVDSPEAARKAVRHVRLSPRGRAQLGADRNQLYDPAFTPAVGNRRAICAVMLESQEAIERAEEIVAVPGVDAVYLGSFDLSVSYGLPPGGLLVGDAHWQLFEDVAQACENHGVVAGSHCPDVKSALRFRAAGYRMLNIAGALVSYAGGGSRGSGSHERLW